MKHTTEKLQKPPKKLGMRHVQSVLLFFCMAIAFGTRACMSVTIVAMTDEKSGNPNFQILDRVRLIKFRNDLSDRLKTIQAPYLLTIRFQGNQWTIILQTFDWDSEQKSLILSSLLWGCLLTQVPMGYLTTNGGAQKYLCFGALFAGVASILIPVMANSTGWIGVICCRVVMGMSQGTVTPCIYKLLSSWVPPSERSRLCSFVINGSSFGTVLFMPVAGMLASSSLGWPSIFYIFGMVSIVWAIIFYFLAADTPSEHPRMCPKEVEYINSSLGKLDSNMEAKDKKFPYKSVLKSLPVWSSLIALCGQGWGYYVFLSEMPSYMKYVLNFDIQKSGGLSALPFLVSWLLVFPFGWFSDFALRKGASVTLVRKMCNTIGTWGPALALLVLNLIQTDNESVYVLIFVIAVGLNASTYCATEINHIDLAPNFSGTLMSLINSMVKCCGMLAPIAVGYIVSDMTNVKQWNIVFYVTALIYFVTNLHFVLYGTAEKQSWNDQVDVIESTYSINASRISTISTTYQKNEKILK